MAINPIAFPAACYIFPDILAACEAAIAAGGETGLRTRLRAALAANTVGVFRPFDPVTGTPTPLPTVTLGAVAAKPEGDSGATVFTFTVNRSASVGAVNVPWAFAAGTTIAADFTGGVLPSGGVVALADGAAAGTFTISAAGDATVEGDESFYVSITAPTGYAAGALMSATGTILNDDVAQPTVTLTAANASRPEGNSGAATTFVYTVMRSSSVGAVAVPWSFLPGTTSADDFTGGTYPAGGNVAMADGVVSGTFTVSVNGDAAVEPDESFSVLISTPAGYVAGATTSATGTIVNDDVNGTPPPATMRFIAANQRQPLNGDRLMPSAGLNGFGGRQLCKFGFAAADIMIGFQGYLGEGVADDYTVVKAAFEYAGAFIPITFAGARSKVITAAESTPLVFADKITPAMLQAAFGVAVIPRDAVTYVRYEVLGLDGSPLPGRIDGNGDAEIPGQVCYRFAPGNFNNAVDGTGALVTPTGGARAATGGGAAAYGSLAIWSVTPSAPVGAEAVLVVGDSIARGLGDSIPGVVTGGGYPSRAAIGPDGSTGTIAMAVQGASGEKLSEWLDGTYRKQFLKYANVVVNQHLTNDLGIGGAPNTPLATIKSNFLAFWALCRAAGVQRIVVPKVGPRTDALGPPQVISAGWEAGGNRDQIDAWLATKLGTADGFDAFAETRSPITNPFDDHQWRTNNAAGAAATYPSDAGTHPASTAAGPMGRALRVALLGLTIDGVAPTVPAIAPVLIKPPGIYGTPTVGTPIVVQAGAYAYSSTTAQTILKAGVSVGSSYTPVQADVGAVFTVSEAATNSYGTTTIVSGPSAAAVANGSADTTAPIITSSPTYSQPENSALTAALTANETVTWALVGGADMALFSLSGANWTLAARDYELPSDADSNNTYIAQFRARDTAGNDTLHTVTVTITDVSEGGGAGTTPYNDDFTPTPAGAFQSLNSHTSPTGHTYATKAAGTSNSGSLGCSTNGVTFLRTGFPATRTASFVPDRVDYDVVGVLLRQSTAAGSVFFGGRCDATALQGFYVSYENGTGVYNLRRYDAGTSTVLGNPYTAALATNAPATVTLRMRGNQISVLVGNTVVIGPVTDGTYTAAGRIDIRHSTAVQTEDTSVGLTNLSVVYP